MITIIDLYLLLQQPLGVFDICFYYTLFVWLWVLDETVQFDRYNGFKGKHTIYSCRAKYFMYYFPPRFYNDNPHHSNCEHVFQ